MDGVSQLSITLANADSTLSELNAAIGFKGSQLTVYFAFADLPSRLTKTESTVLFRGIAGDPDEITEDSFTVSFLNKLSLQRIPLPDVRIQRSCPWNFPSNSDQRQEAKDGGENGSFSRFYRCGYSPDVSGGFGDFGSGQVFTSCDKSRRQCEQRGMFNNDAAGNLTRRFGGFEFVPSAVSVRTSGGKSSHLSPLLSNSAKYNDSIPVVYGAGWLKSPVIFARNDGNLTHMEVLAGLGPITSVLKVVVNDVEIPQASASMDMTSTGWYSIITPGSRAGNFNLDFSDANGNPLGDPYGSLAVLAVVVPNRISSGSSLPNVEVLLQGIQVGICDTGGNFQGTEYSNNPAWVLFDILRRCGWSLNELNIPSFATSAAFCNTVINTKDFNGNTIQVPRYECNLVLTKRQSVATVVRGIRTASSLMLRYGANGLLELLPETTLAAQQPTLPDGANSIDPLSGGWPAYEFSDASAPFSGIMRNPEGGSSVRLLSRTVAETSNRLSVEFQDKTNEYQHDSLSIADSEDSALIGYEISSQSTALGISNFNQATRVLLRQLDKSIKGNLFVELQTSFRALKIRPGDIIALTYLKEGFERVPFRVVKLSPSINFQSVTVLAQIHNDDWYSDDPSILAAAGRQPGSQVHTPRPLIGLIAHNGLNGAFEYFDFKTEESIQTLKDGTATDRITVSFAQPRKPSAKATNLPLLSLASQFENTGGSLTAGSTYYYAVSAVDEADQEGPLSFTVPALIPEGTNTNCVTITGISLPAYARSFNVYRGVSPQMLYCISMKLPINSSFTDNGLPSLPIGPPDASFDHVNLYYRFEYSSRLQATGSSPNTLICLDMGATDLAYAGMIVRIIEGAGAGQERLISRNDSSTLTVTSPWSVVPDFTSEFVICEPSWRFAAVSSGSPAQFEIAYQTGTVIQISGRAANVYNQEGAPELCPLTRLVLGQGQADFGVPAIPAFSLEAPGGGNFVLSQVGFNNLANIASVSSGTLQLFYWNELADPSSYRLDTALDTSTAVIRINSLPTVQIGDFIQISTEVMSVVSIDALAKELSVVRGACGSPAIRHAVGEAVLKLDTKVIVVPFASGFFENRASVNFLHTFRLPDARVSTAEFFVTNAFGNSQVQQVCFTQNDNAGLRTLSGGQFSLQVSGYLATQQNAAPPLVIESSHAVRDVRASLNQTALGYDTVIHLLQNGTEYCSLVIPSSSSNSDLLNGVKLPPLQAEAVITMNVSLKPTSAAVGTLSPGRDLTVTIRL
ncbi:MAG: phage tail protein [Bryobacteraceae bacterium]